MTMKSIYYLLIVLSHAVAFIRFSQSAYSQDENSNSLLVSLELHSFGGSGSGSAEITQDIFEEVVAFAQGGDTATGKEIWDNYLLYSKWMTVYLV